MARAYASCSMLHLVRWALPDLPSQLGPAAILLALGGSGCSLLVNVSGLTAGSSDGGGAESPDATVPPGGSSGALADAGSPQSPPPGSPPPGTPPLDANAPADGDSGAVAPAGLDAAGLDGAGAGQDSGHAGDQGVRCGSQTCPAGASVCCYSFDAGPLACAQSCPSPQLALPCDDTADCIAAGHAGTLCCVSIGPSPGHHATSVGCAKDCPSNGDTTPLCDPQDQQATRTCPSGSSCQPSLFNVPGYQVCK